MYSSTVEENVFVHGYVVGIVCDHAVAIAFVESRVFDYGTGSFGVCEEEVDSCVLRVRLSHVFELNSVKDDVTSGGN